MKLLPWDEIQLPVADYNVRLASTAGSIPVYWAKDHDSNCLLLIELTGDLRTQYSRVATSVSGIHTDLRQGSDADRQNIVLTLEKHVDADLFHALCLTLMSNLALVTDSAAALSITFNHIKRWKSFLGTARKNLMTAEQIRGLFAELYFLRTLYQSSLGKRSAINSWYGAEGVQQDFIFLDRAVEVKSLTGRERNRVRISSESQLETLTGKLFLVIYNLREIPDDPQAFSLNEAVQQISDELDEAESVDDFYKKAAEYGYVPIQDYDTPKLRVTGLHAYEVTEGFPRLTRSQLPVGVVQVSYDIEIEKIARYAVGDSLVFGAR